MAETFEGFAEPRENWSKLPHVLIEALPLLETRAELLVVLYVLRHTWGFQEFEGLKRMTLDEFQKGRKRRDGSRMDAGTGLSLNAVKDGVKRAVAHGFLVQEQDGRDPGRQSHRYGLRMVGPCQSLIPRGPKFDTQGTGNRPPGGQELIPRGSRVDTRSEKDTRKETQRETRESGPWPRIKKQLQLTMLPETFAANFSNARARVDGDVVRVGLQSEVQVGVVERRLRGLLQGAVDRSLGEGFEVLVGVQGGTG